MLRMVQSRHAAAAKRYFDDGLAREDYYTPTKAESKEPEEPSRWGGLGATRLGLSGKVEREAFHNLCDNRLPDGSGGLTARTRADRRVGYDINFHCPKSVSILHAITGDRAIVEAFRAAVGATMEQLEADVQARVRKNGAQDNRTTGNLVWAEFIHTTTRPIDGVPDPLLHAHCFTFNATFDASEKRWKAGELGNVNRDIGFFEAAFHNRLASGLRAAGYGVQRAGRFWEVEGVSRETIEKYSRRQAEIEALAAKRGINDPDAKAGLGAKTRRGKDETLPWDAVLSHWRGRLSPAETKALGAAKGPKPNGPDRLDAGAVLDAASATCFDRAAVVRERGLLEEALRQGVGRVALADLGQALSKSAFIRREQQGVKYLTTNEALKNEATMLDFARAGRGSCPPLSTLPAERIRRGLPEREAEAVARALSSRDRVTLLPASSKAADSALRTLVARLEESGHSVARLNGGDVRSPSAQPRDGVFEGEARRAVADTRGRLLVVERAHQLGLRDMAALFTAAKEGDARVILESESRRSKHAARPVDLLKSHAGLRASAQRPGVGSRDDSRTAARSLREGRFEDGFARLDRSGGVRQSSVKELPAAVAAEYAKAARDRTPPLVLAGKNQEALTHATRLSLYAKRLIGASRPCEQLVHAGLSAEERREAESYKRGQVVVFYKGAKGFRAGHRYDVVGKDPFGNVLAREGLRIEALPLGKADRFQVFNRGQIEVAKGDVLRTTHAGRTKNERFGIEKLLSKRQQAERAHNLKHFTGQVPDRRYRVPKGAVHRVAGFTLKGDIKLDNGWVLPKNFGLIEHGYCAAETAARKGSAPRSVFVVDTGDGFAAKALREISKSVRSVFLFTDDKERTKSELSNATKDRRNATDAREESARQHAERLAKQKAETRIERAREVERDR